MPEAARGSQTDAIRQDVSSTGLYIIGIYKLVEASLLAAAGFGVLRLLHKDVGEVLQHWVHVLRADPDNRYVHALLSKAFSISPKQLREFSAGTFIYAALRLAEGIGLVMRKRWGEYLTVVVTAMFIPLEMWELARHFTWLKVVISAGNIAIVIYLINGLARSLRRSRSEAVTTS